MCQQANREKKWVDLNRVLARVSHVLQLSSLNQVQHTDSNCFESK